MIPGSKIGTAEPRWRQQALAAAPPARPVQTEAVGLLAAGIAHDLNNMLGGIVATAELLELRQGQLNPGAPGEDLRDLRAIIDQAGKASRLIRQILAFSRQELLKPVHADIGGLVIPLVPMLSALAGQGIQLDLQLGTPLQVRIDPTAFERVLINLVLNARDAIGSGGSGRIRIGTARLGPGELPTQGRSFMPEAIYGVVTVEDDGPGIAEPHRERVFEPYFTTRANGQGLGLSTAYGLVKQSGGYLLHDQGPMGGARFGIYLPEAPGQRQERRATRLPVGSIILLAEDELLLRMSVARGLERLGYRVRQAADGESALARLEEERPSLLISDIRMPGMDGIALTKRARERHPGLPVLLVSGFADEAARAAVPALQVSFLQKPFTLKTLGEQVQALL